MKRSVLLLAVFSIIFFAGCRTVAVIPVGHHSTVTHTQTQHIFPPVHPGHGHRHHYYGDDMVYNSDYGAYEVLGYDGIYFYDEVYLRFYAGSWQITSSLNGKTWYEPEHHHVPDRLRHHRRFSKHWRGSPPPHAPAHGYRHHHNDVNMVFDVDIGAYIVLGFVDLFFFNDHYMRFYDGYWHHSDRHDGTWLKSKNTHVPQKLRTARKHNKKSFFKKYRKKYKNDHTKYRKKRNLRNRRDSADRNKSRDQHDSDRRHQSRDEHKSRERHSSEDGHESRKKKGKGKGPLQKTKNKAQKKKHKKGKKSKKGSKKNKSGKKNKSDKENKSDNDDDRDNDHRDNRDRRDKRDRH